MVSSRVVFNRLQISSVETTAVLNTFMLDVNTHSKSFYLVCSTSACKNKILERMV